MISGTLLELCDSPSPHMGMGEEARVLNEVLYNSRCCHKISEPGQRAKGIQASLPARKACGAWVPGDRAAHLVLLPEDKLGTWGKSPCLTSVCSSVKWSRYSSTHIEVMGTKKRVWVGVFTPHLERTLQVLLLSIGL